MRAYLRPFRFLKRSRCVLLSVSVMVAVGTPLYAQLTTSGTKAPIPSDREVRDRANALLKQMTPQEKLGQLSVLFLFGKPSSALKERIERGELGSGLFVKDPAIINAFQHSAVEGSRLHIPMLFGFDVIHGFRTIFPVPLAMAATWDPDTVTGAQTIAAAEARSTGINWVYAPMVDIARDPRWGRIVEGAGEDPYLGAALAAAQVHGFQGPYIGAPGHVVACAKHFAGYGAAQGGRDYEASEISDSEFYNVYLPPFKGAIEAGSGCIMSAYMDLNGVPASGNRWLLHNVLREQLGFKGFVVSDSDAVKNLATHGFAVDGLDATLRAFNAGVNIEMALGKTDYSEYLPVAVQEGLSSSAQLDEAVRPVLETKIRLGLFENPYVDETLVSNVLDNPSHRTAALHAAEESAVLLRNEGSLLPLKAESYKKVAVIGPLADSKLDITGPWTFANVRSESVTVLEGLKQQSPQDVQFDYSPGVQIDRKFPSIFDGMFAAKKPPPWTEQESQQEFAKAVTSASNADLTILVLGENQNMDGESASSSSLELPGQQEQLLEAVVATHKPVVLVLLSARPLDLRWANAHVNAILDAWYPGTEGGAAIANLLYGRAIPSGKLPITWPRDVGQLPMFYAHNLSHEPQNQNKRYWNEESSPLFPFGYGLSYTHFEFSDIHVKQSTVKKGEPVAVSVTVRNNGAFTADAVTQVYIHQRSGTSSRPVRELKGFRRVTLAAGESKNLDFTLRSEDLMYWSSATRSWIQDAAPFDIWIGEDSTAMLHETFVVKQ